MLIDSTVLPNDKTLWPMTAELYEKRMKETPEYAIGDQGYRSGTNQQIPKGALQVFIGKSLDVDEEITIVFFSCERTSADTT